MSQKNSPLDDGLLLEFAKKLIDEGKLDSLSASQLDNLLKEFRLSSKNKMDKFMRRLTPDLRYRIRKEYNKFIKSGITRANPNIAAYKLEDLKPKFRKELDNAISNSLSLIRTQNEQTMLKLEQRFRNWSLTPSMDMRKSLTDKTRQLQGFRENVVENNEVKQGSDKHLQFVVTDQYRKMIAAMDRITADELGAIGFFWHTRSDNRVVGKPGGLYPIAKNPKMHGDHYSRNGKFYLYKNTWAANGGYVVPRNGIAYSDSLPDGTPGIPIFCRCWAESIYHLDEIPEDCLTGKGRGRVEKLR